MRQNYRMVSREVMQLGIKTRNKIMIEYEIISGHEKLKIVEDVNVFLTQGWTLHGNLIIQWTPGGLYFAQALFRSVDYGGAWG
jgi:hypothetical protein